MDAVKNPLPLWKRAVLRFDRWLQGLRAESLRRQFASCGRDVSIQWPVVINGADHLSVGNGVSFNAFVHIWAQGGVALGDGTLVGSHVTITSLTHATDAPSFAESLVSKPVDIGRNVWIGAHAVILPGIRIGDGAIIGAGAVVNRDVAAGDVVAGVPAVSIRAKRS
jgi:acetyltransferase-like isoleucine patch superfamily enzyme